MKPVLSICIPTYNRSDCLRQLLESIKLSCPKGENQYIELVISNNASTDDTETTINNFRTFFPNIKYFYQREALLPAEKNFLFVAKKASAEYVWLMGDDDKLNIDSLTVILEFLNKKADLYLCNFGLGSSDMKQLFKVRYHNCITNRYQYNNKNDILLTFGPTLSLISSAIFKRIFLNNFDEQEYIIHADYGMSFLYLIYSSLPNTINAQFINNPLFTYRCANSNIKDWGLFFVHGIAKTLESLEKYGYSKRSINRAKKICIKKYVFRELLSRKARCCECRSIINGLFTYYFFIPAFWMYCIPLILIPNLLLKILRRIYQKYFKFSKSFNRISER